jgi:basic membrane protein A and related proteins
MKKTDLLPALALVGAGLASPAYAEDKIGFIYVGLAADAGCNTSMDYGRKYVEAHMPGVTTTAFEMIPETAKVERATERLIAGGHNIIFATSYGYLDYAIKVGRSIRTSPSCTPGASRHQRTSAPIGPTATLECT